MTSLSSLSNSAAHLSIPWYHSNLADGSHDDCQRRFAITSRLNAIFFSVPCSSSTAGGKRLFVVALALHSFKLSIVIDSHQCSSIVFCQDDEQQQTCNLFLCMIYGIAVIVVRDMDTFLETSSLWSGVSKIFSILWSDLSFACVLRFWTICFVITS